MRLTLLTLAFVLTASFALADEAPLDLSPEADMYDDVVLQNTLYVSISAEDIYRNPSVQTLASEQAKQMMAASRRRIARQERSVEELKKQVETGKADPEQLKAAVAEMNRRIEVGYLALARSTVLEDIVRSAQKEQQRAARRFGGRMEKFHGERPFTPAMLRAVQMAFRRQFYRPLPISAEGDTALHRALGLDHSGRVDVAVNPDSPEGIWLRKFLETTRIPYYAFRTAIPGSATAPHIHIGPGSTRIRSAAVVRPRASGYSGVRSAP